MRLATRVDCTNISGIRKVFDLAAGLKDPVNLSIGQPDYDVPDPIKEEAIKAIRAGKNSYTQTQGCPELREALLAHLDHYKPEEVLITNAVSGGLMLSYLSLLDPGDEILIPDPYFVMYKQLALMLGAKPVYYNTYPTWAVDADEIESLITPRTKAIVIGTPSNPTGACYSELQLKTITKVLARHDLLAISDEIYKDFCYDGPFHSISDVYENTLVLGGFSKSHAMTGWRLGYAAGPAKLMAAMTKFQQFTFVCAPSISQMGGVAALKYDISAHVAAYKAKRDLIYNGLLDAGYEVEKPGGAFYIFPRVPWGTDTEFVERCIEKNLLVIPGSVFSEKHSHFRIAYAAKEETILKGIEILREIRTQ